MSKLQFAVLASGSKANAVYVQPGNDTGFLLDCGLSGPVLEKRLRMISKSIGDIARAFITHRHTDHDNMITSCSLPWAKRIHALKVYEFGSLRVTPFRLKHGDCRCYGFRVDYKGMSLAYVVDTEYVPEESLQYLIDLDAIIIEANYREEILLSRRQNTAGLFGNPAARHLSNEQATCILSIINSPRLKHVVMAHVSSRNNTPAFVWNAGKAGAPQAQVLVAEQDMPSRMITLMN